MFEFVYITFIMYIYIFNYFLNINWLENYIEYDLKNIKKFIKLMKLKQLKRLKSK